MERIETAETLREARKKRGLSQQKLAEMTGLTQITISALETGRHLPFRSTADRIEEALVMIIDWHENFAIGRSNRILNDKIETVVLTKEEEMNYERRKRKKLH